VNNIKKMKLYSDAYRIFRDLKALGYSEGDKLDLEDVNQFDQLHYHGTLSVQEAIETINIKKNDNVLEVGAGWGGPSRYIAYKTRAHVSALELQKDYSEVGQELTLRTGLDDLVMHINQDFLNFSQEEYCFNKIVSWLALYHIPDRKNYTHKLFKLLKKNGMLFIEDLTFGESFENSHRSMLEKKLFANSLEKYSGYLDTCANVGFEIVEHTDMSSDWESFTNGRLKVLQANRKEHEKIHGIEGYMTIEDFYTTAAECFAKKIIGGIRLICKKN
jgi:cyclopropane fatty-acyl-phospholipid synthase-like methyltransferase